jgi:hypothetical protein
MPNWVLALTVKPFFALAFIALAGLIAYGIGRLMPPSRLKTFLFKRR